MRIECGSEEGWKGPPYISTPIQTHLLQQRLTSAWKPVSVGCLLFEQSNRTELRQEGQLHPPSAAATAAPSQATAAAADHGPSAAQQEAALKVQNRRQPDCLATAAAVPMDVTHAAHAGGLAAAPQQHAVRLDGMCASARDGRFVTSVGFDERPPSIAPPAPSPPPPYVAGDALQQCSTAAGTQSMRRRIHDEHAMHIVCMGLDWVELDCVYHMQHVAAGALYGGSSYAVDYQD